MADNIATSNGGYANYLNTTSIDPNSLQTTSNIASAYDNTSASVLSALSAEMKEYYSQYLIKSATANLVHGQFLESEALPKGHGRTIEWRKWTDFSKATTPLTEGITPEPSKISVNPIRATLSQYGDWTLLTDQVQLLTIDNTLVEITEKHSQNAKLTLDTITREAMIAGVDEDNVVFAGSATAIGNLTSTIVPNDVARLTAYLRQNNAPTFDGSYVMIVHPYVAYDLMTNANWIDVVKYSDTTKIFDGEIGKLYGIRFVQSTESKVTKAENIGNGDEGGTVAVIKSVSSAVITLADDTLATADATALAGKKLYIQDVSASTYTVEEVTVSSVSGQAVTLTAAPTSFTAAAGDKVWLSTSASGGADYFTCLVLGKGAGKKVAINGDNAEMIIKPIGSAGSTDALNQRGSVGWKIDGYTAAITNGAYIFKYYCCSALTGAKAND